MKTDFQVRRLCLNMIVKNEAARIERCLASVLPYISSYAITDTGSTDGTPQLIEAFFRGTGIKGEINHTTFVDFSQARNEALGNARLMILKSHIPHADYFLLVDADMELEVTDPHAFDGLQGLAYNVVQKSGGFSYHNTRLLSTQSYAKYEGVTHEYLSVPTAAVPLAGVHFIDHADGANRVNKFARDIALLTASLETDPKNGRTWYYLAQSYRDAGAYTKAAYAYKRRVELGGWDEETWTAQMGYAGAMKALGVESSFVTETLKAYNMRPCRAEALHALAKHFREKGEQATALLFIPEIFPKRPDDILFVNDAIYEHGFKEEYAICAYYSDAERERGREVNDALALSKTAPPATRECARANNFWYLRPLAEWCPSFQQKQLKFQPPYAGYTPMNPSITNFDGMNPGPGMGMLCNLRCVNYRMDNEGRYLINGTDGEANATNPIDTRNFVIKIGDDLSMVGHAHEIVWSRPAPAFDLVTGLEDVRLYRDGYNSGLCASACVRELNVGGVCQQVSMSLDFVDGIWKIKDYRVMSGVDQHEKNWMPVVGTKTFAYRLDTMKYPPGDPRVEKVYHPQEIGDISGGSQLVRYKNGWIAVVHESRYLPGTCRRYYQHRFAWFNQDLSLRRLSLPFLFQDRQIEFCAGLAEHPNGIDLVLSYGIRDEQAWLGQVSKEEVAMMCRNFHEN